MVHGPASRFAWAFNDPAFSDVLLVLRAASSNATPNRSLRYDNQACNMHRLAAAGGGGKHCDVRSAACSTCRSNGDSEEGSTNWRFSTVSYASDGSGYGNRGIAGGYSNCQEQENFEEFRIYAHSIILASSSEMMRSWLSRWSQEHNEDEQQADAEPGVSSGLRCPQERGRQRRRLGIRLDLDLPPDELSAGQAVVRYMYTQTLDGVEDDWELFNCMMLADRWLLPDCAIQCASRLQSTPAGSLCWRVRAALLALPPGLAAASPQVAQLQARVEAALLRTFRCPEVMWEDPDNRQLLLSLPSDRLAQLLLSRDDLQVTSENVVLALLSHWLQHHLPLQELLLLPATRSLGGDIGGGGGGCSNGSGSSSSNRSGDFEGAGCHVHSQEPAGPEELQMGGDCPKINTEEREQRLLERRHEHEHGRVYFDCEGGHCNAARDTTVPARPRGSEGGCHCAAMAAEAEAEGFAAPPEVEALLRLVRYGNLTPHYRTAVAPLLPGLQHLRLHREMLAAVNAAAAAAADSVAQAAEAQAATAEAAADSTAAKVIDVIDATAAVASANAATPSSQSPASTSAPPSATSSPCPTRTSSCCLNAAGPSFFTPDDTEAVDGKLAVQQQAQRQAPAGQCLDGGSAGAAAALEATAASTEIGGTVVTREPEGTGSPGPSGVLFPGPNSAARSTVAAPACAVSAAPSAAAAATVAANMPPANPEDGALRREQALTQPTDVSGSSGCGGATAAPRTAIQLPAAAVGGGTAPVESGSGCGGGDRGAGGGGVVYVQHREAVRAGAAKPGGGAAAAAVVPARPRMPYSMQRRIEWSRDVRDVRIHLTGVGGPSQGYEGASSIQLGPPIFLGGYVWRLATRFVVASTAAANAVSTPATASRASPVGGAVGVANAATVPGLALVAPGRLQLQLGIVCAVPLAGTGAATAPAAAASDSSPADDVRSAVDATLSFPAAAPCLPHALTLASCTLGVLDAAGKTAWKVVHTPCVLEPDEATATSTAATAARGGGLLAAARAGAVVAAVGRRRESRWEEGAVDGWDLACGQEGVGGWQFWSGLHGMGPTWWESGSAMTVGGVLRLYGMFTLQS